MATGRSAARTAHDALPPATTIRDTPASASGNGEQKTLAPHVACEWGVGWARKFDDNNTPMLAPRWPHVQRTPPRTARCRFLGAVAHVSQGSQEQQSSHVIFAPLHLAALRVSTPWRCGRGGQCRPHGRCLTPRAPRSASRSTCSRPRTPGRRRPTAVARARSRMEAAAAAEAFGFAHCRHGAQPGNVGSQSTATLVEWLRASRTFLGKLGGSLSI